MPRASRLKVYRCGKSNRTFAYRTQSKYLLTESSRKRREDMTKVVVVMKAKNGKFREAIGAVKMVGEYVTSKHDLKSEIYMQLYGTAGTIYLMAEYKDVASAQAAQAKMMADDGYWALAQKMAEVLIDPPIITLLQSV
jgi:hypothetical protein